ncbi:MAG: hypothetical protein J6U92_00575 [Clostridia bacterium]|nr:hypothetical protein [Clostridia bacterium]
METKVGNKNLLSTIAEKFKNSKKLQYITVGVLSLIVLFVFCYNFTNDSGVKVSTSDQVSEYVYSLENKLSNALSKVEGAGDVSVVITVKSGNETVLATSTTINETANGTEKIETPLVINGKTIIVKEKYPEITGVLIVANGASNIYVMTKIQQATVSLLDISPNQIEILTMK